MDKILKKDLEDLEYFFTSCRNVNSEDYDDQDYYHTFLPAMEALEHLFITLDNLQKEVEELKSDVGELQYHSKREI